MSHGGQGVADGRTAAYAGPLAIESQNDTTLAALLSLRSRQLTSEAPVRPTDSELRCVRSLWRPALVVWTALTDQGAGNDRRRPPGEQTSAARRERAWSAKLESTHFAHAQCAITANWALPSRRLARVGFLASSITLKGCAGRPSYIEVRPEVENDAACVHSYKSCWYMCDVQPQLLDQHVHTPACAS